MWCRISRRTPSARSEGIDGISQGGRTDVGLQALAIDDINGLFEKTGDVFLQFDVVEHRDPRGRIDFDHDIEVAVRPMIASCDRTKQGSMPYAALTQGAFGTTQGFEGF